MTTTTTITPVVDLDTVARYQAGDAKVKGRIRAELNAAIMSAVDDLDMQAMTDAKATLAACTTSRTTEKKVTDYGAVVAQRIADLRAAADLLESGSILPEGITPDHMTAPTSTPLTEALDVVEISDQAERIAAAKVTRSDLRRSIQAVYERAFDAAESDPEFSGFLTCQQIANLGGFEGYRPSSGAVAARLVDKHGADKEITLDGFTSARAEDGTLGAVRI